MLIEKITQEKIEELLDSILDAPRTMPEIEGEHVEYVEVRIRDSGFRTVTIGTDKSLYNRTVTSMGLRSSYFYGKQEDENGEAH